MIATLTSLLRLTPRPQTEDDAIRAEWELLLEAATSPQERDEINDLFGRTVAA